MLTATMDKRRLNQQIWHIFTKSYGLTLKADAATFLLDKISAHAMDETQVSQFLSYMAQSYAKVSKDRSGMVDRLNIELVFNQVFQTHNNIDSRGKVVDIRPYVHVIDAFKTPKFIFNQHKRSFERAEADGGIFGGAESKANVFAERFSIVRQRVVRQLRANSYAPQIDASMTLTPLKSIKGIKNVRAECLIFGCIAEIKEGNLFMQDEEEFIQLDFSKLQSLPDEFVTEGSFWLLSGWCLGQSFLVRHVFVPVAEARAETLSMLTHPDMSVATNFMEPLHELKALENRAKNAQFVIMSDVWLDQPKILERFKTLFETFGSHGQLPEVFILIGPFSSVPASDGPRAWSRYQDLFDNFSDFIMRLKGARQCKFIFVPASTDPGFPNDLLPRRSLPAELFDSWTKAKLDFVLASNPCRIIYFTQEIVIYRQDVCSQMRKLCVNAKIKLEKQSAADDGSAAAEIEMSQIHASEPPSTQLAYECSASSPKTRADHEKALKALLDQSTLTPFILTDLNRVWNYEHAMNLYPVPDLLVVADKQAMFRFEYDGCQCANPGPFPSTSGTFLTYRPADKAVEVCELNS